MNRSIQMDEFLQYWAKIYMQNPNYPIDKDVLYSALMEYGLTDYEKQNPNIHPLFQAWENYFHNNPSLLVYHDQRQSNFLQFRSRGDLGTQHVKLYLTYPPDKMEYCVKKVFEYIANNRMVNGSKVANRVRSDSIVLRMTNYDDALKVMDFINRDPELVMYARPTNPFMMRNGKVGVSYDDNISYNSTLMMMMSQYFEYCRQNNCLHKVNHKDFRNYVSAYAQNTFRNANNLLKFQSLPDVAKMSKRFSTIGDCLLNYEQVLKLITMQLDGNMNMERYRSFYMDAKDYSKNRQMVDYYNQLLNNSPKKDDSLESTASMEEIALINGYIEFAKKKYGSDTAVIAYLKKYTEENNINAITRDGNFRKRFEEGMNPRRALFIMQNNVEAYVKGTILEQSKESKTEPTLPFAEQILQEYIDIACIKYGDFRVANYLLKYVEEGLTYITKENDLRNKFLQYLPPTRLLEITNQNIKEYVQSYIRKKNQEVRISDDPEFLYQLFIDACQATYQKYGYNQLRKAIECGLNENYAYFTDGDCKYKSQLMYISKEQFSQFCVRLLETYGTNMGENIDLCDKCAETIEQMITTKNMSEESKKVS